MPEFAFLSFFFFFSNKHFNHQIYNIAQYVYRLELIGFAENGKIGGREIVRTDKNN